MYARISGYGQTGPKAQLPGYASVCEAYGGFRCVRARALCLPCVLWLGGVHAEGAPAGAVHVVHASWMQLPAVLLPLPHLLLRLRLPKLPPLPPASARPLAASSMGTQTGPP